MALVDTGKASIKSTEYTVPPPNPSPNLIGPTCLLNPLSGCLS